MSGNTASMVQESTPKQAKSNPYVESSHLVVACLGGDKTALERTEGPFHWNRVKFDEPPDEQLRVTLWFIRVKHQCGGLVVA